MIPYFISTTYSFFGIHLQTWGTFVALGFIIGIYIAGKRAKTKGLNSKYIYDLAFWIFIGAFVGARLFHVLFYEPMYYFAHPLEAIDPRKPGFAIFGGFLGTLIPFVLFVRKKSLDFLVYADALIWGLPLGCGIGRIGCFLIHDHPGTITRFFLGIKYSDGIVRHDLGLYLSIIGFIMAGVFFLLSRSERRPGFWIGLYFIIEGCARFLLDFLRIADTRYLGLTPTQYAAIPMILIGIYFLTKK